MDKEEEKKLGRLFAQFADENNVSIIKIGVDVDKDEEIKRLNKSCREYQEKFSGLKDKERKKELAIAEKDAAIGFLREEIDKRNKEINKMRGKIVELQKEIKIRIENSNRFSILDIRD